MFENFCFLKKSLKGNDHVLIGKKKRRKKLRHICIPAEMQKFWPLFTETSRKAPKIGPRQNEGVSHSSLHIGTRNSSQNITKLITMCGRRFK